MVAPQIFGHTLRINPLLVIFALLIGLQLYGIIGALVALPILSVLRETAIYLHRHLELESVGAPVPAGGLVPAGELILGGSSSGGASSPEGSPAGCCERDRTHAPSGSGERAAAGRAASASATASARRCTTSASTRTRARLVAVIGPNGAGKTTCSRFSAASSRPSSGTRRRTARGSRLGTSAVRRSTRS